MTRHIYTYDKSEHTPIEVIVGTVIGIYSLFLLIYMWFG